MSIVHMYNPSQSPDIESRKGIIRLICDQPNINIGDPFNINFDVSILFKIIEQYRNVDDTVIFFIHHSDASINVINNKFKNNWPQNIYVIFYSGEGVYAQDLDNMKSLKAWFPSGISEGSEQYDKLVSAVKAAAIGNVDNFKNIDINKALIYAAD